MAEERGRERREEEREREEERGMVFDDPPSRPCKDNKHNKYVPYKSSYK